MCWCSSMRLCAWLCALMPLQLVNDHWRMMAVVLVAVVAAAVAAAAAGRGSARSSDAATDSASDA